MQEHPGMGWAQTVMGTCRGYRQGTKGKQYNTRRQHNPGTPRMLRTHAMSCQSSERGTHLTEREKSP